MHIFTLCENEAVVIGDNMIVRVVAIEGDAVQLEIEPLGDSSEEQLAEVSLLRVG
ncbi:MAG: hypothetical protein ACYC6Y_08525 [Thermoguttaceae bacterium]